MTDTNPKDLRAYGLQRWLITAAVMLVTVIEVLDMTIVNVALPPMMGELSATSTQITWVLTSYIVSAAVFMPLTGFLVHRFGRKKLLLMNIIGFLTASMLCGVAQNLPQIVFFRVLQGVFGAGLVPISQFILQDTFGKEESGKAMAIWGIGVMVAPILGPTLGGYITDVLNWRWVFFINIPVCLIAFYITLRVVKETATEKNKIDWLGMVLMATSIGCLQMFLDQGHEHDWLESKAMTVLALISIYTFSVFIVRGLRKPDNIINLRLFKNRNFCLSTICMSLFAVGLFGAFTIQPILLGELMQYPSKTIGVIFAPRGLSAMFTMMFIGPMMGRIDNRLFIFIGILLSAAGTFVLSGHTLQTDMTRALQLSNILQGIGMGFFFPPLSTLALSTLKPNETPEASGLFSFGRSIGGSIGISLISTVVARYARINWSYLSEQISFQKVNAFDVTLQSKQKIAALVQLLDQQSTFIAFMNAFMFASACFLLTIPFIFFLKPD